ncbi:hypothetical protein ElyMa_002876000 [Elysia marginata]|uniref:Uncharacterized protein n=1 Tax=Elysia marginata TaxID=1093978 RepID=A0AAV4HXD7_9GAST|nr:hypothetical protein ElyMa_002876000 [Elysia marginata]
MGQVRCGRLALTQKAHTTAWSAALPGTSGLSAQTEPDYRVLEPALMRPDGVDYLEYLPLSLQFSQSSTARDTVFLCLPDIISLHLLRFDKLHISASCLDDAVFTMFINDS